VEISLDKEHPFLEDKNFTSKLARYTFNLVTGEATMKTVVDDLALEFPVINQKLIGQKNRYSYISYLWKTLPADIVGQ
jgi:carotenoid cleavage dioxygenase-like enzyme